MFAIGKLNKRIKIIKRTVEINENGFEIPVNVELFSCWAEIMNLYGREYWAAKAINEENTVNFLIRYDPRINLDLNIQYKNKIYNIVFIDNFNFNNTFLKLKCICAGDL